MTHTFVVNTENVNEYGYRILTDGIETVQYLRNPVVLYYHERARDPKQVVGRVIKLEKVNNELIAEIEFDVADDFAAALAGKVERGFIRMCSLKADVIEGSVDEALMLPGQKYETVTKCKLVEISIVDIGGNDDALKLSRNGEPIKLKKIEPKIIIDMSLKTIALALALTADATDVEVLKELNILKLAKETAEANSLKLEKDLKDIQVVDSETLVDKAIELGLMHASLKDSQMAAFKTNFTGQKVILSKMITEAEADQDSNTTHQKVKEVVLGGKGKKPGTTTNDSFDYLQKHNVVELKRLREEEPKKYAELAKAYGEGVRYAAN